MIREILPGGRDIVDENGDVGMNDDYFYLDAPVEQNEAWVADHVVDTTELKFIAPEVDTSADSVEVYSDEPMPQGRQERLMYLKDHEGFYPQSNQEFNRMMLMSGNADSDFRALIHLGEVGTRQQKLFRNKALAERSGLPKPVSATDKPKLTPKEEAVRSLRSIVREFGDYAKDARALRFFVGSLHDQIKSLELSNLTSFKNISHFEGWRHDGGTARALTAVAKYIETQDYALDEGDDSLGKRAIIDNDDKRNQRVASRLDNLRVSELLKYSEAVQKEQNIRYRYWVSRLNESTGHVYVRGQAYEVLRNLGEA